ncbi:hypothetical protein CLOM_g1250 [Closterium sp. NIES-68]|nr:hypothetical protein CLOM_g1250 [Closterium sp. NIES-68]GJP80799.1 hypothetical protein CLOP_g10999 [Closterium sp. NIES-67]
MRLVDDPLVPVRLDLEIGDQRLQDAFCWNSNEPEGEIAPFAEGLVKDTKLPHYFLPHIVQAIQAQVAEFRALHAQDLAAVLGATEENVHLVKLDVCTATCIIRDQFLWDLNNPYADPEAYAAGLCSDLGITDADPQAQVWVAVALREQLLELARQMLASKEPRSSKRPRRERGGSADPKATAAAALPPAAPVGATALAFMRRAGGRISVRRPRKEWSAFEPQVEFFQTPTGAPAAGTAAGNVAGNAAAGGTSIAALGHGGAADVATPGHEDEDTGAADVVVAASFSADVDLDADDEAGAGEDTGNGLGIGADMEDKDIGYTDRDLGEESDDLGGVEEDEVYLSSYLPKRGPRHHM